MTLYYKTNMRKEYLCELCNFKTKIKENFRVHNTTKKHKKSVYDAGKYKGEMCNYSTSLYHNYEKHLKTQKHQYNVIEEDQIEDQIEDAYEKKINILTEKIDKSDIIIEELIKQNKLIYENQQNMYQNQEARFEDQKEIFNNIAEMTKTANSIQGSHNTINNLTNNNTFNLQFFLNETCKNAMNIEDFVESIVIDVKDLKYLGNKGYVEGISSIIIDKLNKMSIEMRPMHCTDIKRENIYVRTDNNWEKEDTKKTKTNGLIREVQRANTCALQDVYQKTYPQCMTNYNSKEHKEYGEIIHQNFWGGKDNQDELNKKIIRKVVQEIPIEKNAK